MQAKERISSNHMYMRITGKHGISKDYSHNNQQESFTLHIQRYSLQFFTNLNFWFGPKYWWLILSCHWTNYAVFLLLCRKYFYANVFLIAEWASLHNFWKKNPYINNPLINSITFKLGFRLGIGEERLLAVVPTISGSRFTIDKRQIIVKQCYVSRVCVVLKAWQIR